MRPNSITPGLVSGGYILDVELGTGGMAEVWRGRRLSTGEAVAIKVLSVFYSDDPAIRTRFDREGAIRMEHPNIVKIQDYLDVLGRPAIVMQYYPNGSLENRIRPSGFASQPLHFPDTWRISRQILSALDYAHTVHHVIHRDVKPANILLDEDGNAYLADFGIALDMNRYGLTCAGGQLGTPQYMSPEQRRHPEKVTHLTDVYSFALVMYEMLTGRGPFDDPDGADVFVTDSLRVPGPRHFNHAVPRLVDAVVRWGLVREEGARVSGCLTFSRCLEIAQHGRPWTKFIKLLQINLHLSRTRRAQRRRHVSRYAYGTLAVVCILSLVVWAGWRLGKKSESAGGPTVDATAGGAVVSGGPSRKHALLVGINKYKYPRIPILQASVNDVKSIREVLIRNFGFSAPDIVVLTDEQATHSGVVKAIREHLINTSGKDDVALFYFSGHGSQTPDLDGDETDGMDETLVVYDSTAVSGERDIIDDELNGLMRQLSAKTSNISVILDSSHSGTGLKDGTLVVKQIPPDRDGRPVAPSPVSPGSKSPGGFAAGDFEYTLITAARERQQAFEDTSSRGQHGSVLTHYLTEALRRSELKTWRDVMDVVSAAVTTRYPEQNPQLEGTNADRAVFGDASRVPKPYFTVTEVGPKLISLNGGEVHGVTSGSIFAVYPAGSVKLADPERSLGNVRIATVSSFASRAEVMTAERIPPGSRAVERQHRYADVRLRVLLHGANSSPWIRTVRQELDGSKYVEFVAEPPCHMQVRERNGRVETLSAGGFTLSPPLPVAKPDTPVRLAEQLKQWAKWFNIFQIRDSGGGPAVELKLMAVKMEGLAPVPSVIGRIDSALRAEDRVELEIVNNSDQDLYVSVLDMESTGRIQIAYPSGNGGAALLGRKSEVTRRKIMTVPTGRTFVTDTFKLFASTQPIDFSPLVREEGIKSLEEPGTADAMLSEFLGEANGYKGSRDEVRLGDWTTRQKTVLVRRR